MPTEPARRPRVGVIGSYAKALVMTTERIPVEGETLLGRDYRETHGGKGSDMAVQAARLGADVVFVGVVGDDAHGHGFLDLMAEEGVDTAHVRVTDAHPTGVGLIVKDTGGANIIVVDMGANTVFGQDDLDAAAEAIRSCDVVVAQLEIPVETALAGLAIAKEAGATTVLNPAPAVSLIDRDLSMVDYITPNETEAAIVAGGVPDEHEAAAALLSTGAGAVAMTLGERGALVMTPDGAESVPAIAIDLVDSNGAGDSFNAALCTGLAEGMTPASAAEFACVVAGMCCEGWETVPSYRDRDAVTARIAAQ